MTRHFSRVVLWVLTIVALNACAMGGGAIKVSGYTGRGFPASSEIRTLDSYPKKEEYVKIASLSISGSPGQDRAQLLTALMRKAASLGANALVIVSEKAIDVGNQSPTVFNPSGGNYQSAQRVMQLDIKAEAIRVK